MKLNQKLIKRGIFIIVLSIMSLSAACSPAAVPSRNQSQKIESHEIRPATGSSELNHMQADTPQITVVSNLQIQADQTPVGEVQAAVIEPKSTSQMVVTEDMQTPANPTAQPEAPSQATPVGQNAAEDAGPLPPIDPTVGNLAPDFTLTTLDGKSVSLSELRGRPVVLNYWVTWCIPCRDEMPAIESLQSQYEANGLVVLSINGTKQDVLGDVEKFVSELGLTFPVLLDQSEEVYNSYRVLFMPTSFFIDQRGVIQDILLGSTTEEGFRTRVENLINGVN